MEWLLAYLLALSATAAKPTIPESFRGRWNPSLTACSKGEGLEEIRIEAGRLDYYEWTHEPYAVRVTGPDSISIMARLYDPGSGADNPERPTGTARLSLAVLAEGQRLAYRLDNDAQRIYVRCKSERRK